jgi:AcrR family transcriptional regulator
MKRGRTRMSPMGDGDVLMGPGAGCLRGREGRLLAAFERGVGELAFAATPAWRSEREWAARIRACLAVLLGCLEQDRALGRLLFVEALAAGPRVLAHRARVLEELAAVIDGGRVGHEAPHEPPPLTAEGAVGAAFGLIHVRLCGLRPGGSLVELLDPLMAMIVLPYRGRAAAGRELARPGVVGRTPHTALFTRRSRAHPQHTPTEGRVVVVPSVLQEET